jgi:hypothetical protein
MGCSGGFEGGVVVAGFGAEADGEAVPGVDGGDEEGEVGELFVGKVGADAFVDGVVGVGLGDEGEGFGPFEGGTFLGGITGIFAPGVEGVETVLGLAEGAEVLPMHVDTVGATVDLRGAEFDEVHEVDGEFGGVKVGFEATEGLKGAGGDLQGGNALGHGGLLKECGKRRMVGSEWAIFLGGGGG